jgi:hypothetical protein
VCIVDIPTENPVTFAVMPPKAAAPIQKTNITNNTDEI